MSLSVPSTVTARGPSTVIASAAKQSIFSWPLTSLLPIAALRQEHQA